VLAAGQWWSSDEIEAMASRWRVEILDSLDGEAMPAGVVPATPEAVALIAALTSLPLPAILLSSDPSAWQIPLPLPAGTRVALLPSLAYLAPMVERQACVPLVLSAPHDAARRRRTPPLALLQSPGIILFTSGSTGAPKPVFRAMESLRAGVTARLDTLGLETGEGMIAGVSLAHGHGMTRLLSAMILGGPLGLLNPLDYRAGLAMLAMPEFACWSATAHFADVFSRCTLTAPAVAPRLCLLSSPISRAVFDAFQARFGVPLRQNYSSSETGPVAVDAAPAADVQPDSVGRPLPGVDIRIGEHPDTAAPAGETGRIWVRSPWLMRGYGFPPSMDGLGVVDGWWPTRDMGRWEADGRLVLAGRIDDCIRTREGRLVNLAFIASRFRAAVGVSEAVVVPLPSSSGASFGAVIECGPVVTVATLKDALSDALPSWAWPRMMAIVPSLPRLPSGKPDRQSCAALLREQQGR
jgi:acyl-CoA synthetase (AMP-forming)/AMP-acid ligase II